jgi:putative methyltransferase
MGYSSSPYQKAAFLLNEIWERQCGIKSLVYDKKGTLQCTKSTYAQVCKVLAHQATLRKLLQIVPMEGTKNEGLLYVLLYELLLGPNKAIQGGGVLKRKLVLLQDRFQTALKDMDVADISVLSPAARFPRYVRVNTLQTTTASIIQILQKMKIECYRDPHVPDLLVLPRSATKDLQQHDALLPSKIVLQDKSSCFSALCLTRGFVDSGMDGDYLDACAAPGNKTSHLAALVAQQKQLDQSNAKAKPATIYALDRNKARLESLKKRMQALIPSSAADTHAAVRVEPMLKDFLTLNGSDVPKVTSILLDPSCSGSGIFTSVDRHNEARGGHDADEASRLQALSNFQSTALKHALTNFPNVKRVVYSTCSVNVEENEQVVGEVLRDHGGDVWKLIAPRCLATWHRRGQAVEGLLSADDASRLIRVDQGDDTNGFFVACLERVGVATKHSPPKEPVKEKYAIPFYNGEFTEPATQTVATLKSSKVPVVQKTTAASPKSAAKKSKVKTPYVEESPAVRETKSSPTKKKIKSNDSQSTKGKGNTNPRDPEKPLPKKAAKKLEWKRRQKEQKVARMQKK